MCGHHRIRTGELNTGLGECSCSTSATLLDRSCRAYETPSHSQQLIRCRDLRLELGGPSEGYRP